MKSHEINRYKRQHSTTQLQLNNGCADDWHWHRTDKSHEVFLYGPKLVTAQFHPKWSNGTAGVRGEKAINKINTRFYWEISVSERIFGTSMMFGIATAKARLHADCFTNMLGEDEHGWGLSHKGLLWHQGKWKYFTKPFRENVTTTVGLLFDAGQGTLSYFRDGIPLGIAFTGLNLVEEDLFPMVCSTAAKTEMTVCNMRREFYNLQDRCREVIRKRVKCDTDVGQLHLPSRLESFLRGDFEETRTAIRSNPLLNETTETDIPKKSNLISHIYSSHSCNFDSTMSQFHSNPPPFLEL